VLEFVLALALAATAGWLRPRWTTSFWVAAVPATLAFVWLLLHEDIPGYTIGLEDIAWYVGMSLVVGAPFALACTGA
jgi:hypothetical protein